MGMTTQGRNEMAAFQKGYVAMAPVLAKALPSHISPEKFERTAMVAVQRNPDLLTCDRTSLYLAVQRAAQDGLLPDGRDGAMVAFGKQVQWMPMVAGLMKLARNSGEIVSINAHVAYEGEKFRVVLGDEETIEHERSLDLADTAKPIAVYAVAVLKSGERVREVMTAKQVEKVRNVSRAKGNGPWVQWWDEMARKTAIRRLSKRLPMSTDRDEDHRLQQAIERNDTIDGDTYASAEDAAQASGSAPAIQHEGGRLDALEGALTEEPEQEIIKAATEQAKPAHDPSGGPGTVSSAADTITLGDVTRGIEDADTLDTLNAFVERMRTKIDALPKEMQDKIGVSLKAARHGFEQPRGRR